MPTEFIRVRDTRITEGDNILPNRVPRQWLKLYPHLKQVPSGKAKTEATTVTEPVQPAMGAPAVDEPATTTNTDTTPKKK